VTEAAARSIGPVAVLLYADACRRRAAFYDQNAIIAEGRNRPGAAAAFRLRASDFRAEADRAEQQARALA